MAIDREASSKIVGYVDNLFREFDDARKSRESTLVECYWNTHSEYSPSIQGQWRNREAQGTGSKIFMGQTADKVRGGYAQVSDALIGSDFTLEPIEIDGIEKDEARDRVKKMKDAIDGFLKVGEFGQMLNESAFSGAWSGVGIMRAPVTAENVDLVFTLDPESNSIVGARKTETYPKAFQVDPFTFYPDPKGKNEQDGRGYVLLHTYDPSELRREARALGWDMEAVTEVLKVEQTSTGDGDSWQTSIDSAKKENNTEEKTMRFDVKEFWGIAKVADLKEYGVEINEEEVGFETEDADYLECCLVVADSEVLKVILNPWYPAPYRPLKVWQWDLRPSNQWGQGVAEAMLPEQTVINGAYRLFMDNKALANNPMWRIWPDDLAPGQDLKTFYPGKKWVMQENAQSAGIEPILVPDLSDSVLTLAQVMQQNAENNTGVTFIAQQSSSETATAAAIDQSKLTSINRARLRRLDEIVEQIIEWYVRWVNEVGDPDLYEDAKIPVTVKATGILKTALVRELQTLRMQQLIPMMQLAMQLPKVGPEGTALEGFDISRFFKHLFRAMGVEDIELTDKEREEILLESLGEAGAQLREAIESGGDPAQLLEAFASLAGGPGGAGGGSLQTVQDTGGQGAPGANAGTAASLTGGANNGLAGVTNGVAG